jgi:hypothetical protein
MKCMYFKYRYRILMFEFNIRKVVWLSVVLFTGPKFTNLRMKCTYCYVNVLLQNTFSDCCVTVNFTIDVCYVKVLV